MVTVPPMFLSYLQPLQSRMSENGLSLPAPLHRWKDGLQHGNVMLLEFKQNRIMYLISAALGEKRRLICTLRAKENDAFKLLLTEEI